MKIDIDMANESLGAHLRNLLTPYRCLLDMMENGLPIKKEQLQNCEENMKNLLEFADSDKMVNNLWRE